MKQSELELLFGKPSYNGAFERRNMKLIDLGEFKEHFGKVHNYVGKVWSFRIYGHHLMEEPLKKAFSAIVEHGLTHELKTFDGCFNIRPMRSGHRISVHAWGLAVDFNAKTNPFSRDPRYMRTDFSKQFVDCFKEAGFEWGGDWHSVKDPMHFQLPKTR